MKIELSGSGFKSHLFYSADGVLLQGSFLVGVCSNRWHRQFPGFPQRQWKGLMLNCDAGCFVTILQVTSLSCLTPSIKVRGNTDHETVIHAK